MNDIKELLEVRKLIYFRQVAASPSFRQAARQLGITQPALTRHVQDLEEELGVTLIHRRSSGNRLTEAGRLVMSKADDLLALLSSTRTDLDELRSSPTGTVTLAVPMSFASLYLTPLLTQFGQTYPQVHMRVIEGSTYHIETWLEAGQADVGVVCSPSGSSSLIEEHIGDEELFLLRAGPSEPLPPLDFAELEHMDLVLPLSRYGTRRVLERMAAKLKVQLNPKIEADNPNTIKQLVMCMGWATVHSNALFASEIAAGSVSARRITPTPTRSLMLVTPRNEALSSAARILAREICRLVKHNQLHTSPSAVPFEAEQEIYRRTGSKRG